MEKIENKNSKSKVIIIVLSIVLLAVLGLVIYLVNQQMELKKPVSKDWGQKYLVYLKSQVNENNTKSSIPKDIKNAKVRFLDIENLENPAMELTYELKKKKHTNLYYINKNNIDYMSLSSNYNIELLYEIQTKDIKYYIHNKVDNVDNYISVEEQIKANEKNTGGDNLVESTGITFDENSIDSVTDVNGNVISISKFDQTFIKVEEDTDKKDFDINFSDKQMKEMIEDSIDKFNQKSEILEDNKKEIEKEIKKVENKQEELNKAKEEVEKKRLEEEERKRQEELARGLQVGNYTLKYGTYVSDVSRMDGSMYGTLILYPDGKFHIKANCEGDYPYKTLDNDGTYKITSIMNSFTRETGLEFITNTGVKFYLSVTNNNSLNDQWHGYSFKG